MLSLYEAFRHSLISISLLLTPQLGYESACSRAGAESVKNSVFKPAIIDSLSHLPDGPRPSREDVSHNHKGMLKWIYVLVPE